MRNAIESLRIKSKQLALLPGLLASQFISIEKILLPPSPDTPWLAALFANMSNGAHYA